MRIPVAKEIQDKINNEDVLVAVDWFEWTLFSLLFYHKYRSFLELKNPSKLE